MKRLLAAVTAAVTAFAAPATARAQVPGVCGAVNRLAPFAFVRVGPVCLNLSDLIAPVAGTGLFNLAVQNLSIDQAGVGQIGLVNALNVTFKPEPYIDFGVNTANPLFAQTSYEFYFGTFIDPGLYSRATSTGGVDVTSSATDASISQSSASTRYITVFGGNGASLTPLGVNIGTGACSAAGVLATNTCLYPQPSGGPASNQFAPRFLDNFEVDLIYTQDGLLSDADWNGRADVFLASPVPEPSTVVLVAAGGVLLVGGALRRRQS